MPSRSTTPRGAQSFCFFSCFLAVTCSLLGCVDLFSPAALRRFPYLVNAEKYRDGASGLRCEICKELANRAKTLYQKEKVSYDSESRQKFLHKLQKRTCIQNSLAQLPNPKQYALHLPTLKFDCEDLVEKLGPDFLDALSLKEPMGGKFCAEQDECPEVDSEEDDL
ncbi:unnamed protein product [Amoebophrya sp. A120]|nr:unnamed protein product [Amoebophrya sp. A120]|eukprot:GSA120T00025480001.1